MTGTTMRVVLRLSLALIALTLPGCASTGPGPVAGPVQEAGQKAQAYIEERDILYAKAGDQELRLDLIYPNDTSRPLPLVVFIYGSEHSFHLANKVNFYPAALQAAKRGYVAANITYRTTLEKVDGKSKYEFPAQVHDAKCAVHWLKANSTRYGIDATRVGLVGFSSGGCLALLVGLTDPTNGLEGECGDPSISTSVQAVVNLAGETDAVMHYAISYTYYRPLLGGSPEQLPDRYRSASPVTYVSSDDPPVLTIIGGGDDRLPQAELLDAALNSAGVPHTLVVVPGVSHYMEKIVNFAEDGPVWEFLERVLRGSR